jgi:Transposase and inactivated derivatives
MRSQGSHFSFDGQNIFIGIDAHLKSWTVAILTESGYKERFSQESKAGVLYSHLKNKYPGGNYHSVYESGFSGFSTHYSLVEYGIKNIIVNASDVPTNQKEKVHKTDNVDAMKLAVSLRDGHLEGIYVMSAEESAFREEVRYRGIIVKENTRWKNRIKSYLYRYSIDYPESFKSPGSHWSGKFVQWLKELSQTVLPGLSYYLESYLSQRERLLKIEKHLRELSREERYSSSIKLLMSVPGIGFITAITFLSEIGNVERFKNEREFASYIGIVPTCHDSGDKKCTGEITFRGNKHLSPMLIEAAWTAIRSDIALSACYLKLCKRMTSNDAIIRIARKLSNRMLMVLKKKEMYICGKNN